MQQGPWVQSLVEEDPTCHVAQPKNNYLENKFWVFFFWLHSVWNLSFLTSDRSNLCPPLPYCPALGAWSLNHWIIREVPEIFFFNTLSDHLLLFPFHNPVPRKSLLPLSLGFLTLLHSRWGRGFRTQSASGHSSDWLVVKGKRSYVRC